MDINYERMIGVRKVYQRFNDFCKELTEVDSEYLVATYPTIEREALEFSRTGIVDETSILYIEAQGLGVTVEYYSQKVLMKAQDFRLKLGYAKAKMKLAEMAVKAAASQEEISEIILNINFYQETL